METLKIKLLTETAVAPLRATSGSAGYDLFADVSENIILVPHTTTKIGTGIALALESDIVGLVYARSGLSTKFGITLSNAVGVIDCDYRGEVIVALYNNSDMEYTIEPLAKIAQLVLTPILTPAIEQVAELEQTGRGDGGFGSTGK